MISIGVLGYLVGSQPSTEELGSHRPTLVVDDSSPEDAAESFLDAWRKREHTVAAALSVGEARAMVDARAATDDAMTPSERDLKAQVWDAMADSRLELFLNESEELEAGRLRLSGIASGDFLGHPYERTMQYILTPTDEGWRVAAVEFGEILSDVPDVLQLED